MTDTVLTISEIAQKYSLSNRQVNDLIRYGYLNVSGISRNAGRGPTYLFSEFEVNNLDIYSALQDIRVKNSAGSSGLAAREFKQSLRVLSHYDRFMDSIQNHPQEQFLLICFYLFHLNHYAKRYLEQSQELYRLKNRIIRKLYQQHSDLMEAIYLLGPDRKKIWLCDDCKESANAAGMSYVEYLKKGYHCPKCSINSVEKEYYSLVEFRTALEDYRFTFHLPRSAVIRWMEDLDSLPQGTRDTGHYEDSMYLYGRPVSKIEERVLPLPVIIQKLHEYLEQVAD